MRFAWLAQGEDDLAPGFAWLAPGEQERLARMRFPKRRREVALTRWTAKHAVAAALGIPLAHERLAQVELRPAPDGAPELRVEGELAPLSLSLTDRGGFAVCVVGPPEVGLGCDLELVEPRSDAFVADYFTAAEQVTLAAVTRSERDALANLLWSAKESALKVLRTGLRRDTRSVEVVLGAGATVEGWSALEVRAEEGRVFPGWWRRYGCFLLTTAATRALPPPFSQREPSVLVAATPREIPLDRDAERSYPGASNEERT